MNLAFVRDSAVQFLLTLWHVLPWMAAMGAVFSVLSLFMPCNPGRPWWRKKGLVTDFAYWDFRAGLHALSAHLADRDGHLAAVPHHRRPGDRRFLRSRPWPARQPAALGAGRDLSGGGRFADVLEPSDFPCRLSMEIPCRPSCRKRCAVDFCGPLSSRQSECWALWRWMSSPCCPASRPKSLS